MTELKDNKIKTVIGILLVPILLILASLSSKLFISKGISVGLTVSRIAIWIALALMFLYTLKIEKQSFLIWKDKKYIWWLVAIFVFAICILSAIGGAIINSTLLHFGFKSMNPKAISIIKQFRSTPLMLFTCITAGIVEELLFRGYLIPRLGKIFKSPVYAIIISALFFASVHIGWGSWQEILGPLWIGLVYGFFYWKYRNIKILMVIHFLWDLVSVFMLAHSLK